MRSLINSIIASFIALAMMLPFTTVAMADNTTKQEIQPIIPLVLMLRVRDAADVNQPVAIQVYSKFTGKTVEGTSIYAIKEILIPITSIKDTNNTDFTQLAKEKGIYLGLTDNNGVVNYSFKEIGKYRLVATKTGYISNSDWITITLAAKKALTLLAPDSTEIGKDETYKVIDRDSNSVIFDAAIYAMKIGEIASPLISTTNINDVAKYATEIKHSGIFIGNTNRDGKVTYKFKELGNYVLTAMKDDFSPALDKIVVKTNNVVALLIKSPDSTAVGNKITFTVLDRANNKPVAKAVVFVLKISDLPTILTPLTPLPLSINSTLKRAIPSTNSTFPKIEPLLPIVVNENIEKALSKGIQIGVTNDSGELTYSFSDTGRYIIVAQKEGFIPGNTWINVKSIQQNRHTLKIQTTANAAIGTLVTFKVYDKDTNKPVEGAAVYCLKVKLTIVPPVLSTNNNTAARRIFESFSPDKEAANYAEEAKNTGFVIGTTNGSGEIGYTFKEPGRYIAAAIKDDYIPAYTRIDITQISEKALKVVMPSAGELNRKFTIKVTDTNGKPITHAGIYTIKVADIMESTGLPEIFKPEADEKIIAQSYVDLAKQKGNYIGLTDNDGKISYEYKDTGYYIVIAVKDEYAPAFNRIKIQLTTADKLTIVVPADGIVNQPITISVQDKNTRNGLKEVAVYAYKVEGFLNTIGIAIRQAFANDTSGRTGFAADVSEEGILIDYTDENGNMVYSFTGSGSYLLIAIKTGYLPDFGKINIK
jgi:hypothetical protein